MSLTLAGCTEKQAVGDLKDYQKRLANILDADFTWSEPNTTLTYPTMSQLRVSVQETRINLRDYYALQNCSVNTLIAQRNTGLGKTQLPSTRYFYEVELIRGLKQCLQLAKDQQIKHQLQSWIQQKEANLPIVWANLIQTSEELKQAFSSNQNYLDADHNNLVQFILALEYLIALPSQKDADIAKIENSLDVLRETEMTAKLWKTQLLMINELTDATSILKSHTKHFTCKSAQEKQKTNYLKNVFQKFFIAKIQPLAGSIDKAHYALVPAFKNILLSEHLSPLFKQHIRQKRAEYNDYKVAIQLHVMEWQSLFKRCSLSPNK